MHEVIAPLAFTLPDATRASGIARSKLYELIGNGELDARKAGRRTLITADSLRAYLSTLPTAAVRAPRKAA